MREGELSQAHASAPACEARGARACAMRDGQHSRERGRLSHVPRSGGLDAAHFVAEMKRASDLLNPKSGGWSHHPDAHHPDYRLLNFMLTRQP